MQPCVLSHIPYCIENLRIPEMTLSECNRLFLSPFYAMLVMYCLIIKVPYQAYNTQHVNYNHCDIISLKGAPHFYSERNIVSWGYMSSFLICLIH